MPGAIEAIAALKERLGREKELPIKAVQVTPVDGKELRQLERTRGKVLPEAYLQHGLFCATNWRGMERARMLRPAEVGSTSVHAQGRVQVPVALEFVVPGTSGA